MVVSTPAEARRLTVPHLKSELRSRGLAIWGNKPELLARLLAALASTETTSSSNSSPAGKKRSAAAVSAPASAFSASSSMAATAAPPSPKRAKSVVNPLKDNGQQARFGPLQPSLVGVDVASSSSSSSGNSAGSASDVRITPVNGTLSVVNNYVQRYGYGGYGGYGGFSGGFRMARANVGVRDGRWWFEVHPLGSTGSNGKHSSSSSGFQGVRVGVCTADFATDGTGTCVVAGDAWAFDPIRSRKVKLSATASSSPSSSSASSSSSGAGKPEEAEFAERLCAPGISYVGVGVDVDGRTLRFTVNGVDAGIAFRDVQPTGVSKLLFPFISLSSGASILVNFGGARFSSNPLLGYTQLHCPLSDAQLDALNQMFDKYAALNCAENSTVPDMIAAAGLEQLQKDLGVVDDEDPVLLILAWKLNAVASAWEISRTEFATGLSFAGVSTLSDLKAKIKKWRDELKADESLFRRFYNFVFDYVREENATVTELDTAIALWSMLLGGSPPRFGHSWKLLPEWVDFLQSTERKGISRDAWQQLLHFMKMHPDSVDGYDTDGSWPLLFDDFVEWMEERNKSSKAQRTTEDSSSSSSDSD